MKNLLLAVLVLFAFSQAAFAHSYSGYNSSYSSQGSRYVFQYGNYPSKPFRYYKLENHYTRPHKYNNCYYNGRNNCVRRGVHRQKGYKNYGGVYLKVPDDDY